MAVSDLASSPDRFWARVARGKSKDCWEWQAAKSSGYGYVWHRGKVYQAHRLAWELTHGAIPDGLFILHLCDNRGCVNPSHMAVGDQAANMHDAARKARTSRGESRPLAKLDDATVLEARVARAAGAGVSELAKRYGVDHRTVGMALRGETWRHVGGPRTIRPHPWGGKHTQPKQ